MRLRVRRDLPPARPTGGPTDHPPADMDCGDTDAQSFSTTQAKLDVSKLTLIGRLGAEPVERKVRMESCPGRQGADV